MKLSHTLQSGQIVTGDVMSIITLGSRFQIWAKPYMDDKMSLACWLAGQPWRERSSMTEEECIELAKEGFERIKGITIPEL